MLNMMILLSLSLSMDALGLGISYGMKNVRIGVLSKVLLLISSIIYSFLGVILGKWMIIHFGAGSAEIAGIIIVLLIGLWMIHKSIKNNQSANEVLKQQCQQQKKLLKIALKSIGITIMVIKDPVRGDVDNSGKIDIKEALMLGIALNIDAASACMGSIMVGASSQIMPFLIGISQQVLIQLGFWAGRKIWCTKLFNEKLVSFIPGIVLIFLAVLKMFA